MRASGNRSLQRLSEVISNLEINSLVDTMLQAMSDFTRYIDEALASTLKLKFAYCLDAPSLALVVRMLERGLGDRSPTTLAIIEDFNFATL